jgi:putative oxidoreductase
MKIIEKLRKWGDRHHPKILDIIRMSLGIFLFDKGFIFLNNSAYLRDLIIQNHAIRQSPDMIVAIIDYVTYMHLVGGVLIFLGIYTRLWVLFQLPIILGAVFFVNILSPFVDAELWLSILVLMLLFLFLIMGSGPISLDHLLSNMKMDEDNRRQ